MKNESKILIRSWI